MNRIPSLLFVITVCIFSNWLQARSSPQIEFVRAIPTLNPDDERWEWMDRQIEKDFEQIDRISESRMRTDLVKLKKTAPAWIIAKIRCYEIKNGAVSGPQDHFTDFLNAVIARYPVPDLAFIYAHKDFVDATFFQTNCFDTPILCSTKVPNTDGKVIHCIDWFYDIKQTSTGWNKIISEIDEEFLHTRWEDKMPVLFWRGTTTCQNLTIHQNLMDFPRGRLVQLSLEHSALIDARFNRVRHPREQGRFPQAPFAAISDHLKYKYQIAMDGYTATFPGYQWRLYSGCLNFKQDSDDTMWFYGALEPYVHCIPVQKNLEDLAEKVEWAIENDEKSHEIALNARKFAAENLLPEHMLLYAYKVLSMYASKLEE